MNDCLRLNSQVLLLQMQSCEDCISHSLYGYPVDSMLRSPL